MSGGQQMSTEVLMSVLRLSFGLSVLLFFILVYLMIGEFHTPSRAPPSLYPSYLNTKIHINKDGENGFSTF